MKTCFEHKPRHEILGGLRGVAMLMVSLLMLFPLPAMAQVDSLSVSEDERNPLEINKKEEKNRNVMLNATTQTKPREVSIGLPGSDWGSVIFEDGLPVSYSSWPVYYYFKWAGGNAYSSQGLMKAGESAILGSSIGYSINSYTRLGSDSLQAVATLSSSSFGLLRGDAHVSGPMGRGWYYSASAYANYDPTSVHPKQRSYVNQSQLYKAALTKRWERTSLSLLYKYVMNNDGTYGYNTAPFYYNGDGSISAYEGFRLGRDSYFPVDDAVEYTDIETGEIVKNRLNDMNRKHLHDVTMLLNHSFQSGWQMNWNTRFSTTKDLDNLGIFEAGMEEIDGQMAQQRFALFTRSNCTDLMTTLEFSRLLGRHSLRLGVSEWLSWQKQTGASFRFATTVEPSPKRVLKDGQSTWNHNVVGEYYDGWEQKTALYATDDWTISPRLNVYYGLRLEQFGIDVNSANNLDGKTNNTRIDGYSLKTPGASLSNSRRNWLNPTAMAQVYYTPLRGFSLVGEYIYNMQQPGIVRFKYAVPPVFKALETQMGRVGVQFTGKFLSLTSMLTILNQSGNNGSGYFTKLVGGSYETQTGSSFYDIRTLGWTTDAVLSYKGFNLHLLATLQNPQYKNFHNRVTFSDGTTETFDYSDKTVSGVPRVLLEIDPSYDFRRLRLWASARYYGKQYANKVNNVWFDGHWETFAGAQFRWSDHISLALSAINLINQTGASGTIDVADTILDTSLLNGYLTSGTYIRPFTVEFSVTLKL